MSAGLNSQVGLAFGRYAPYAQPNLRKPDEQRHVRVREPAPKVFKFSVAIDTAAAIPTDTRRK